jgi:hypothetical protein
VFQSQAFVIKLWLAARFSQHGGETEIWRKWLWSEKQKAQGGWVASSRWQKTCHASCQDIPTLAVPLMHTTRQHHNVVKPPQPELYMRSRICDLHVSFDRYLAETFKNKDFID